MGEIHGFKAFDFNIRCMNEFQYEVGKTYEHTGDVVACASGFHMCTELGHVFSYHNKGIYCNVIGSGRRDVRQRCSGETSNRLIFEWNVHKLWDCLLLQRRNVALRRWSSYY